jgi:hypothetical protein
LTCQQPSPSAAVKLRCRTGAPVAHLDTVVPPAVVAVVTDVERDGFPVVGFGFNSNGRYAASGILKERFIPRLLEAEDSAVANDGNTNLDPHKCWDIMMSGEKPGGHGERSVACGVLDMALWDAVAKIEDKPLCAVLAERYGCKADGLVGYVGPSVPMERVWVYAAGGYYQPEKDHTKLQEEMQGYLDMGFKTVKMKIGGAPLEEDIERIKAVRRKHLIILLIVVLSQSWQICLKKKLKQNRCCFCFSGAGDHRRRRRNSCSGRKWSLRSGDCEGIWPSYGSLQPKVVRRGRRPARLSAPKGAFRRLSRHPRDGHGRESFLDAGCAQLDPLWRHAPRNGEKNGCFTSFQLTFGNEMVVLPRQARDKFTRGQALNQRTYTV